RPLTRHRIFTTQKNQNPHSMEGGGGVGGCKSLTMTYFHTGIRTIIGAKAFHCPVRDGKEWYHLAMVVRHNGLPPWRRQVGEFIESCSAYFDCSQRHGFGP